ncbi:PIG-L deacetylase family protein [Psychromonas sp. SA13A]|uniref:PIG-L deacetylase family protein n=1 Tax=Psychromonas sp. SA13A TaxID=2686346 RepID=UPI0014078A1C|nr:PIG-L deacetylase family protein [Psychromonas sp. SA13A]
MTNVLVVVAHADDEVLGCGGTIAKHSENGDHVTLLVMTNGVSAREQCHKNSQLIREKALANSCEILGIKSVIQCDFPDNRMDSIDLLEIVKTIEVKTSGLNPSVVYCHSPADLNIDHKICAQATLTAFRPLPETSTKTILAFEVLSSTEWDFSSVSFQANWFEDISASFNKKQQALACYEDELRSAPHPRSLIICEALANLRGSTIGVNKAEAFQLLRHQR